ncbi:MAG: hypothetical protein AB7O62_12055 [Pirellulales bacterium]
MNDKRLIWGIMLAVAAWGAYHAIGSVWNYENHNPWRGVMVLGCVLAFIGFWLLMLSSRKRRLQGRASPRDAGDV